MSDAFETGLNAVIRAAATTPASPTAPPAPSSVPVDSLEALVAARKAANAKPEPKRQSKLQAQKEGRDLVKAGLGSNTGGDYAGTPQEAPTPTEVPKIESPIYNYDIDKARALEGTPQAFIEPETVEYLLDRMDALLPEPGFITDYVNLARGMESPTLFLFWGAAWTISTILNRHAWLQWYPGKLWPNLYVLTVAPPALCRKSTALDIGKSMVEAVPDLLPSNIEAYEKTLTMITGKATSDGILSALTPEDKIFLLPETNGVKFVHKGSKAAFAISELTMLFNKQQYNINLVTTLTDLYDCKDRDSEITRARGKEPLESIYATLIGATTPSSLKTQMPEEALGGGFLSRLVIAYQALPTKVYSIPRAFPNYPTVNAVTQRLAWIAHNCKGEYTLAPEAFEIFDKMYIEWKNRMFDNMTNEMQGSTRYDVLLLKLAMILRVQEYRLGNEISARNITDAMTILDYTLTGSKIATEDIGMTAYSQFFNAARRIMERRGTVTRTKLQRAMSARGCKVNEFDMIIAQLLSEDRITIMLDGKKYDYTTHNGREIYSLTASALDAPDYNDKEQNDERL